MSNYCIVIRHEGVFDRLVEISGAETTIGRNVTCDIRLPDPCISGEHAILSVNSEGLLIRDCGSRNRTIVNGRHVEQIAPVRIGSRIEIGPYDLTVCLSVTDAIRQIEDLENESTSPIRGEVTNKTQLTGYTKRLTEAQRRVYYGFVNGLSEKEIANSLGISIHTVHDHAKAIYRIASVSSRGELLADWAKQQAERTQLNE